MEQKQIIVASSMIYFIWKESGSRKALDTADWEEPQSKQQALMTQPGSEFGVQNNCSPVWPYGKNKWIDSLFRFGCILKWCGNLFVEKGL